jgi:hypothetical protein
MLVRVALGRQIKERQGTDRVSRSGWAFRQGIWSFGVSTPRAFLAASLAYHLRGGIAEKITCPVFAALETGSA